MGYCEFCYNPFAYISDTGRIMSYTNIHEQTAPITRNWRELAKIASVLFKARVVSLLLVSSVAGAFLSAGGWPGFAPLFGVIIAGGLAAGGASALNQYIERDKDKKMSRTRQRPLPTGEIIDQDWVPVVGINMIVLPSIFVAPFNPALAFFLLLGAFIYVVVYTIWLKPRTLLNIVIGGAAGSAAVLSGAAAAGNWTSPGVLVLALILFLWTPSHFWSLAILYRDDYKKANIPMLPTIMSERNASWWVMSHTLPTAIGAVLLAVVPELGWVYAVLVIAFSADMVRRNVTLIRKPTLKNARRFFISSNVYLLVVLLGICIDSVIMSFLG